MTDSLHSEIVTRSHIHARRIALLGLGCGAIGASVALLATRSASVIGIEAAPPVTVVERAQVPVHVTLPMIVTMEAPEAEPAPASPRSDLAFVFTVGGSTYMKLAALASPHTEDAEATPRHGSPELFRDEYVESAVAVVEDHDVPLAHRGWKGRAVKVDGTCDAKVTGFAVVSRLTGDPGYAGIEAERWTAANVMSQGTAVLAAKLSGCAGTFARDAALPAVVLPEAREDARLAGAAREALIASAAARSTQAEWDEAEYEGNWYDESEIVTKVVRHPRTGVTWVWAHGTSDEGCGGPNVNVWGLFRVDGSGKLVASQLRQLGEIRSIEQLIDVDGDGEFEIIGKSWLGFDRVFARSGGEELARLALPFYGCSC